ncbi:MAG TPA: hypothetical protein VKT32_10655 [Chthonomonadaceae bacterium]|nr:hypothetical protein [Chthonomonadaceae bacterium]
MITVSTGPGSYHRQFLASAARFGVAPTVLTPARWGGLTTKLVTVWRWLRAKRLVETDLVLFADAWDVVLLRSLDGFMEAWESFDHPLVMSAEENCAPFSGLAGQYPPCESKYRYLNSGLYCGRPDALLNVLEDMRVYKIPAAMNDQGALTCFHLQNPGRIVLDTEARLFMSLYRSEDDMEYSEAGARNRLTGSLPWWAHANGASSFSRTLEWLGIV